MQIPIRRLAVALAGAVIVLLVVFGVRLEWGPSPAIVGSVALSGSTSGSTFESDVIETDATLAGLSWTGRAPEEVWVRASSDGDEWTPWLELAIEPEHAPDPRTGEAGDAKPATDPMYFGPISFLQYRVTDSSAEFSASAVGRFTAEVVETSGRGLALRDRLIQLVPSVEIGGADAEAVPGAPSVVRAEDWGSDQCLAGTQPRKLPRVHRVEMAIVHHAGNNGYSAGQDARDLVYAFCNYHVHSRGWWDIAYNFLVDRYGVIYEGRRGSLEDQVRGGHTAGFNSYSVGVALMGNHEEAAPTFAGINALEEFLAWRLDMHHIPAGGVVTVESLGSDKWDEGQLVEFYRIAGHRDAKHTACPGAYCVSLLPQIRDSVAADGEPKFSLDYSDFDPIIPGTDADLLVHAPADAAWTISAIQRFGSTVWSVSGVGPRTVTWDGDTPIGPYIIRADFGALGVHEQIVQVGSYEWPFVDDEGSYAAAEIDDMWDRGITVGCDWNRFCPEATLTKAEIATLVSRAMEGEGSYPSYSGHFTDVPDGQWYTGPIEFLVEEGVVPGGGEYGIDDPASRALVVDYILGALGVSPLSSYQGYFTDVPEGEWYTGLVERAHELGIAVGYPDGTFRPDDTLSRQEAGAFLMRGLE